MEKIVDENYYDLIISNVMRSSYDTGDNISFMNARHSLAHFSVDEVDPCDLGKYPYSAFPSILTLNSSISIEKSGIGAVQRNPYLGLFGQGVIVAVIDTGIDYQHPAFRYKDGTTRILYLWDQTRQGGEPPQGFTYGTEYSRELINVALKSEEPLSIVPSTDTDGHGTAIASVIAGTPNAEQGFTGVVPEAEFIIIKMKQAKRCLKDIFFVPEDIECYQESDLIIGLNYVTSIASKLNRPIAICIAMGTNQSSHDGRGATSYYTDYLTRQPQVGICIAAGNETDKRRHYYNETQVEPFINEFEMRVGENDKLFGLEIWPNAPSRLSVEVTTPNREKSQVVYPGFGDCMKFDFVFNPTKIWINNFLFDEETGDPLMVIRFQDPAPGVWVIRVENLDKEPFVFHSWLPSGNLISKQTVFLNASPDTTITPPGTSTSPLTVAAFNQRNNSILSESGRGYTRTGTVKPDISAPGYQITCALPGNQYGTLTGTGLATAQATGISAMVFEWAVPRGNYTTITGIDVNRLLVRGANQNEAYTYPNNIWGYGQIDIENLFKRLTNI